MTTSRWENQIVKTNEEIRKNVSIELITSKKKEKKRKKKKNCQYRYSSFSFRPMG